MRVAREIMAQWGQAAEQSPLSDNLIPARNYGGLNLQDDQLRIWLPDPARVALIEICNRLSLSLTAYLTELFATYLYGIHEVMRMRDQQSGLYDPTELPSFADGAEDHHAVAEDDSADLDEPVPELGKNIFALKIFVPARLKQDLQYRADKANVPLGRFARAMICAHLFGRDVGPQYLMQSASQL